MNTRLWSDRHSDNIGLLAKDSCVNDHFFVLISLTVLYSVFDILGVEIHGCNQLHCINRRVPFSF